MQAIFNGAFIRDFWTHVAWSDTHDKLHIWTIWSYLSVLAITPKVLNGYFYVGRSWPKEEGINRWIRFRSYSGYKKKTTKVVMNYVSALKYMFARYRWSVDVFENSMIKRMLRGMNYTVHVQPSPKGLFTLQQVCEISRLCGIFADV